MIAVSKKLTFYALGVLLIALLVSSCGDDRANASFSACSIGDSSCKNFCDIQADNAACSCQSSPTGCQFSDTSTTCSVDPSQAKCAIAPSIVTPLDEANLSQQPQFRINFSSSTSSFIDEIILRLNNNVVTQFFEFSASGDVATALDDNFSSFLQQGFNTFTVSIGGIENSIRFIYDTQAPEFFITEVNDVTDPEFGASLNIKGRLVDSSPIQEFSVNNTLFETSDDQNSTLVFENSFDITVPRPDPTLIQNQLLDSDDASIEIRPIENLGLIVFSATDLHGAAQEQTFAMPSASVRSSLIGFRIGINPQSADFVDTVLPEIQVIIDQNSTAAEKQNACLNLIEADKCNFLTPNPNNPEIWSTLTAIAELQPVVNDAVITSYNFVSGVDSPNENTSSTIGAVRNGSPLASVTPFIFNGDDFRIFSVAVSIPIDLINQYLYGLHNIGRFGINLPSNELRSALVTSNTISITDDLRLTAEFITPPFVGDVGGTASIGTSRSIARVSLQSEHVRFTLSTRSGANPFQLLETFDARLLIPTTIETNFADTYFAGVREALSLSIFEPITPSEQQQELISIIENSVGLPEALRASLSNIIPGPFLEPSQIYNSPLIGGFMANIASVAATNQAITLFFDTQPAR